MKIIKASEPILISQIKAQIFGQPGCGKTSFALTAEKPLLLDFDKGAHRAVNRADTLEVTTWADVVELLGSKDDLSGYRTLVCDTGGKMLDFLGAHIISENGKLANAGGALTLQGYGVRKAYFQNFLMRVGLLGLDIIIVSHDKEKDQDEVTKVRPDVGGSSYADIMKDIDLCGYMEIIKGKRIIDFNPTERSIGKNCAGFPQMEVDKVTMAELFAKAKEVLNMRNAANVEVLGQIDEFKAKIATIASLDDATLFLDTVKSISEEVVKQQVRKLLSAKTMALGFKYSAEAGGYIMRPEETPAAPEPVNPPAAVEPAAPVAQ
jgi:hypothetical protein